MLLANQLHGLKSLNQVKKVVDIEMTIQFYQLMV